MTCPQCDVKLTVNENAEWGRCRCGWAGYLDEAPPAPDLEALWQAHHHLLELWAWKWAAKAGRDPTDTWDACVDAFLRAAETWSEDGGANFATYLTKGLWLRLRYWSQREMLRADRLPTVPLDETLDQADSVSEFRQALRDLSPAARQVVGLVLEIPGAFDTAAPRRAYRELKALCRKVWGWTPQETDQVFQEIKEALASV